ncbi:MAG TPA: hypothetical protein VHL12_04760 [Gemmatimonadaceae bacterium]|nr:hypothetical protein [Gemmatimonadaceae bacterium]
MIRSDRIVAAVVIAFVVCLPRAADGQNTTQAVQPEVRVDGIFARTTGIEAALGLTVPTGIYVRTGLIGGLGGGPHGVEGRTDLVARFSMDPFRQSRWAPYAGAGLSGRYRTAAAGGARAYLLVFLGIEGPLRRGAAGGWVPALEVGLGGGTRVGIGIRKGIPERR